MQKTDYLHLMGIDVWKERDNVVTEIISPPDITERWAELERHVKACTACPLHKTRSQTVFGVGNRHADLLLIGEAPGEQEDLKGEPFVGAAGQLLNKILAAVNLTREEIYITNILKSRPPNNRAPTPEEQRACTPFLIEQIALIQPKLIVALGRTAAQFLLNTTTALGKLRTEEFRYGISQIPLRVTYHPAYLLRVPEDKRKAWEDWQKIQTRLTELQ